MEPFIREIKEQFQRVNQPDHGVFHYTAFLERYVKSAREFRSHAGSPECVRLFRGILAEMRARHEKERAIVQGLIDLKRPYEDDDLECCYDQMDDMTVMELYMNTLESWL